jgi:hypothetical protein
MATSTKITTTIISIMISSANIINNNPFNPKTTKPCVLGIVEGVIVIGMVAGTVVGIVVGMVVTAALGTVVKLLYIFEVSMLIMCANKAVEYALSA